ncbi:hypothetical protein [Flavobacterium sp. ABG]|uniref:hypothetical protein n=1 Tax=Flavobacterium sp. ABG TaxID=1423322 RepID=UPI00064A6B54|nr:hypothetical protein [Flavobacterium sp. ABG]KLT69912.1 hypothetical protein AB674_09415 [Flavobacterium sp. ABG]
MSTTRKQTELEILQQKHNKIGYIKSYPILTNIEEISLNDIKLIELVLSYQDNDQEFKMSYEHLGNIINTKASTIGNIVLKLTKLGVVISETKSNFDGVKGGKVTKLSINLEKLISLIPALDQAPEPKKKKATPTPEPIASIEHVEPKQEVPAQQPEPTKPVVQDAAPKAKETQLAVKKAEMKARFDSYFHYGTKGRTFSPADFHSLTDFKFRDALDFKVVRAKTQDLLNDNFEAFWLAVQELKKDLLAAQQVTQ